MGVFGSEIQDEPHFQYQVGPIHHVKNMRDYTLFARCCPPAIALDFVHFYTQTGDYLGTSEISTVLFAVS